MKRTIHALLILFLSASPLSAAAMLPGYDFTFFKTINDSLMINDDKRFGIDYTGYGFIGSEMSTGIYLRIGLQAPFSSLASLFDDKDESDNVLLSDEMKEPDEIRTMLETSFAASLSIGPAFRHYIGDAVMCYLGLGFSTKADYDNIQQRSNEVSTELSLRFSIDMDLGFRIDITDRTTLRIGLHILPLLAEVEIDSARFTFEDGSSIDLTDAYIVPNIFLPSDRREHMEAGGYISLGHTFRERAEKTAYRYRVSDGTIEPIR